MKETKQEQGLRPGFTPLGIWAFSIGTSIGWGSFIVTCNTYLQKSGLLGTVPGDHMEPAVHDYSGPGCGRHLYL